MMEGSQADTTLAPAPALLHHSREVPWSGLAGRSSSRHGSAEREPCAGLPPFSGAAFSQPWDSPHLLAQALLQLCSGWTALESPLCQCRLTNSAVTPWPLGSRHYSRQQCNSSITPPTQMTPPHTHCALLEPQSAPTNLPPCTKTNQLLPGQPKTLQPPN